MARRTRTAEQRGLRTRAASTREIPTGEYQGDLYIPPQLRNRFEAAGYKLSWIRRSVRNQEDGLNIRQRTLGGWKPVDATQAAELVAPDWFGEEGGPTKKFIEVGGLILCQCPVADYRRREKAQEAEAHAAINRRFVQADPRATALPMTDESTVGFERSRAERVQPEADAFKE